MTKDSLFRELDERVKKLTREYDSTRPGDPRRAEMENEISALYLEQHNLKSDIDVID
jgi:hypothetical protein